MVYPRNHKVVSPLMLRVFQISYTCHTFCDHEKIYRYLFTLGEFQFAATNFRLRNTMTHVVYGIDDRYLPCLLVSMYSVLVIASGPIKITVFSSGQNFDPSEIHNLAAHFPNASVDVREFATETLLNYEMSETANRFPSASMIPLFIPWLIDEKCIFLDADTLVLKDISQLYSINLNGCLIGATPAWESRKYLHLANGRDFSLRSIMQRKRVKESQRKYIELAERIGYSISEFQAKYFSSGVILFDTEEIRRADPSASLMNINASRKHWDGLPDQDRLNDFFKNRVHYLDIKWNVYREISSNRHLGYIPDDLLKQIQSATQDPGILHFPQIFHRRPWARPWYKSLRKRYRVYKQTCKKIEVSTGHQIVQMFNSRLSPN